jgi:hypothetical protein
MRLERGRHRRLVVDAGDDVAARDVELVLEPHGHRHRREGLPDVPLGPVDGRDAAARARREHDHLVAGSQHAAGDLARVAAVVVVGGVAGADHVLDGEADVDEVAVRGHVHVLEVVEQRRALVPGHVRRAVDHVVAFERADRDQRDVGDLEAGGERADLVLDLLEALAAVVDEVHLVDAHHEVGDPQQ